MRRPFPLLALILLAGAFLRLWQLNLVPPGLHYDLAATALLGNEIAFNGYRPVFLPAYTGHEALFYYWLALWFRLIGSSVFSLRLAAALLGVLTLPASYFAVREALRFERHSRWLALFATAALAFSFFHVTFSRFGFRVITQPLVQCLALGFLFRGLNRLSRASHPTVMGPGSGTQPARVFNPGFAGWDFLLAGAFTGLAAYTYLAARLFPLPLAIFWLVLLLGPEQRGRHVRALLVFSLAAALVFAPLGAYFIQHPQDFINRASQVAPRPGEAGLLLQGVRRAAEMIFLSGEPYSRYNLPGRPLLDPVLGALFVLGLGVALRRLFAPGAGRAREALLLAWLPAMLLPTALAVHDVFPSNIRAFGVIPLLFVFPARGLVVLLQALARRWPRSLAASSLSALVLGGLLVGTLESGRAYFWVWARLPEQRLNNDGDLTAMAEYLNGQDLSGTAVFVSALHYRHPTLAYLARNYASLRWMYAGQSLAIPPDQPALYVVARSAPLPAEWLEGWEPYLAAAPLGPDGVPDFRAYLFRLGQAPPLPEYGPAEANFANLIFLTGQRVIQTAEAAWLDLRWRVENLSQVPDLVPYARLLDAAGNLWSQSQGFNYPSEQWQVGEVLVTRLEIPLPAGLPPGGYTFRVGLYSEGSRFSPAHLDAQGAFAGERAPLPEVRLSGNPALGQAEASGDWSAPAQPTDLEGGLRLRGFTLPASARQGEWVPLRLLWQARAALPDVPLTIALGGQTLFTGRPALDELPFSEWSPGQWVIDWHTLKVPAAFPPGPAEMVVEVPGQGSALLGMLEVQAVERSFSPPPAVAQVQAVFGADISLHGYALEPGAETRLVLHWRALAETPQDYTVFVHVLDSAGVIAAQADAQPRAGAYPTSLWAPGEYISDPFSFSLPPGRYSLELGLYRAEDGTRLSVHDSRGTPLGDALRWVEFDVP